MFLGRVKNKTNNNVLNRQTSITWDKENAIKLNSEKKNTYEKNNFKTIIQIKKNILSFFSKQVEYALKSIKWRTYLLSSIYATPVMRLGNMSVTQRIRRFIDLRTLCDCPDF